MANIFIDGEAGTTGLEIRNLLRAIPGVEILSIAADRRKEPAARKALMARADLVILCLPNEGAVEAVALLDEVERESGKAPRVIDASSAHRTAPGWVFGFPELAAGQAGAIRTATRVSNPGCYSTGAIALIRPLVDAGLIPRDFPLAIACVSGYTGGGRQMIEAHESGELSPFHVYGLGLAHKHLPEIVAYTGLRRRPIFMPAVGNYRQGMVVEVPLHLDELPGKPTGQALEDALRAHYGAGGFVSVEAPAPDGKVDALALNGTNRMTLRVHANEQHRQAVLVACLDNLGKGASGAAVQNVALMLGIAPPADI
jgi:N-acetyl-gamma-glutamyl-phosphate reductase